MESESFCRFLCNYLGQIVVWLSKWTLTSKSTRTHKNVKVCNCWVFFGTFDHLKELWRSWRRNCFYYLRGERLNLIDLMQFRTVPLLISSSNTLQFDTIPGLFRTPWSNWQSRNEWWLAKIENNSHAVRAKRGEKVGPWRIFSSCCPWW